MKLLIFFFFILIFLSCNLTDNKSEDTESNNSSLKGENVTDTIDYCRVCDSLDSWQGGIQGVNFSDSTGVFPFAECHTNKFFDLIWVPKGDIIKFKLSMGDDLEKYYYESKKENYKDLDCYSFVIPKTKHTIDYGNDDGCGDCEDLDTYDYVFPSQVNVFKKTNNGWKLLSTKNIKSFEELGRLKLNTIFQKN